MLRNSTLYSLLPPMVVDVDVDDVKIDVDDVMIEIDVDDVKIDRDRCRCR